MTPKGIEWQSGKNTITGNTINEKLSERERLEQEVIRVAKIWANSKESQEIDVMLDNAVDALTSFEEKQT